MSHTLRVFSPLLLALVTFVNVSQAQECTSDAECPESFTCDISPSSEQDCTGPDGCSDNSDAPPATLPVSPETPDASTQGGMTEGDMGTDVGPVTSVHPTPNAPSGADGGTRGVSVGSCEPAPFACSNDADCPTPTTCGPHGICELKLEFCEASTECDADYACTALGTQSCEHNSPGDATQPPEATPGAIAVGPDAAAPLPPAPTEPTGDAAACEAVTISACFPAASECEEDTDCSNGWTCTDISGEGWPDAFDGVDHTCLPPGYAALVQGHVGLDAESERKLSTRSEDATGEDNPMTLPPAPQEDIVNMITNTSDPGADLGTQGGSEGAAHGANKSGCSVTQAAGTSPSSRPWFAALLAVAGGTWLRRRRAAPAS